MPSDQRLIVEAALAAGARGDAEAAMSMFSPAVVAHYARSLPFGGDHDGLPAYLRALGSLNEVFRLEVVDSEVTDTDGDRVILLFDIAYTASTTGRQARQRSIEILTFTGDRVTDVAVYNEDAAALLALLEPRPEAA
jgi:ketosteroid isomerase-like protein